MIREINIRGLAADTTSPSTADQAVNKLIAAEHFILAPKTLLIAGGIGLALFFLADLIPEKKGRPWYKRRKYRQWPNED